MKKLLSLLLCFILVLAFSACGKNEMPKSDNALKNTVKLPLDSFYGYDNGLLLKVNYYDYITDLPRILYNPQDALYYDNGELYRLKATETQITLNSDITSNGTNITLPIKYYIFGDMVHAYFAEERTQIGTTAFFKGIKGDTSSIIVYDAAVKYPIIYNLKDHTYKSLYDGLSFKGYFDCISDDGKYIMVAEIDKLSGNVKYSVLDILNQKTTNIPLPKDENGYKQTPTPFCFADGKLILKTVITSYQDPSFSNDKWYEFDINNKALTEYTSTVKLDGYTKQWQSVVAKSDTLEGKFSVYNFKTEKEYIFDLEQPAIIALSVNETGEYAFGSYAYYGVDPMEFDQDGNPIFSTPTADDYINVFWDFKNEKEIDIEQYLTYAETYKDYYKQYQWISETALLVTYVGKASNNQEFIGEILDLKNLLY